MTKVLYLTDANRVPICYAHHSDKTLKNQNILIISRSKIKNVCEENTDLLSRTAKQVLKSSFCSTVIKSEISYKTYKTTLKYLL